MHGYIRLPQFDCSLTKYAEILRCQKHGCVTKMEYSDHANKLYAFLRERCGKYVPKLPTKIHLKLTWLSLAYYAQTQSWFFKRHYCLITNIAHGLANIFWQRCKPGERFRLSITSLFIEAFVIGDKNHIECTKYWK